jgi:Zn finger protein HypA/HybF involved in hydrogenase expression
MKWREEIPCQKCKKKVSWNIHHLRIYCDECGSEIKDHQINPFV